MLRPVPPVLRVPQAQVMMAGGSSSLPEEQKHPQLPDFTRFQKQQRDKVHEHLAQPREEHLVAWGDAQRVSNFSCETG